MSFSQAEIEAVLSIRTYDMAKTTVRSIEIPPFPEDSPVMAESYKPCTAALQMKLGAWSNDTNTTYDVKIGGTIPCSEEDFWSGRAHEDLKDHLEKIVSPLTQQIEQVWLLREPEELPPLLADDSSEASQ